MFGQKTITQWVKYLNHSWDRWGNHRRVFGQYHYHKRCQRGINVKLWDYSFVISGSRMRHSLFGVVSNIYYINNCVYTNKCIILGCNVSLRFLYVRMILYMIFCNMSCLFVVFFCCFESSKVDRSWGQVFWVGLNADIWSTSSAASSPRVWAVYKKGHFWVDLVEILSSNEEGVFQTSFFKAN